jgi:hypothetical protein
MGNAEEAGDAADDTYEEDDDFESEIDNIMKEVDQEETGRQTEMAFNTGGFVNPSYYNIEKAPKNPALDIRYFNDAEGKMFYMPFINGKPMKPMPNGAIQVGAPTKGGTDTIDKTTGGGSTDTLKDLVTGGTLLGGGASTIVDTTATKTVDDTKAGAGTSVNISGTYTGSNLADFGRSDMIYNPGGSGAGGEIVGDDLWNSSVSKLQTNLGSAALSTLAAAMGVPGIFTMLGRAAMNKYGTDAMNAALARANQEMAARAGGIDLKRTEPIAGFTIDPISGLPTSGTSPIGVAAAASQIDQLGQIPGDGGKFAAISGAGKDATGGRASSVGQYVYESLKDTGLSAAEIAAASQEAVNAVIGGKSMSDAVSQTVAKYDPAAGSFGVRLSDMDVAGSDTEGSLYEGLPGRWGDFDIGVNTPRAPSVSPADIGFDYSSFDFIDFGTSMPQTKSKPKSQQEEEEGRSFYDDSYRTRQVLAQMEDILGRKQSFEQ